MTTIRLHDPDRTPAHWSEIIRPGQYAVFVVDAHTNVARDPDGVHFAEGDHATVTICESREEAKAYANSLVDRLPSLSCQIYDHLGKAKDAVEIVYHESIRHKHAGPGYHRREIIYGVMVLCVASVFIIIDIRRELFWLWGYILGLKLTVVGVSLLIRGITGLHEVRSGQPPPLS